MDDDDITTGNFPPARALFRIVILQKYNARRSDERKKKKNILRIPPPPTKHCSTQFRLSILRVSIKLLFESHEPNRSVKLPPQV